MRFALVIVFYLTVLSVSAQKVPVMAYNEAEKLWTSTSDTVYLVNYWATWCKPCIEELPDFLKLNEEYKNRKFKMILVSLDFPQHIESRVIPFMKKKEIKARVILLDDNANTWINKVNSNWDGSIPVTQIIYKNKKEFYNKTLNYNELKQIVEPKLK
jgi:thiol-disulfide isomerase/thioredoxin